MKGLFAVLLALGITLVAVFRLLSNYKSKQFGSKLVRQIDQDPEFAQEIAAEMQNFYGSESLKELSPLDSSMADLEKGDRLGKFEILRKVTLPDGNFLLVTLCRAADYDASLTGTLKEVTKVYQLNFLLKNNPEKNRLEVYSDFYDCLTTKLLRKEFVEQFFLKAA